MRNYTPFLAQSIRAAFFLICLSTGLKLQGYVVRVDTMNDEIFGNLLTETIEEPANEQYGLGGEISCQMEKRLDYILNSRI